MYQWEKAYTEYTCLISLLYILNIISDSSTTAWSFNRTRVSSRYVHGFSSITSTSTRADSSSNSQHDKPILQTYIWVSVAFLCCYITNYLCLCEINFLQCFAWLYFAFFYFHSMTPCAIAAWCMGGWASQCCTDELCNNGSPN